MTGLVLFETTESIIEVLWDIALALFIVRLSFVYFFLAFSTGTLLSYIIYTRLLPVHLLTTPQSELALVPVMLVLTVAMARFIIVYYEIPRVSAFRLATGGVALFFMIVAELLLGGILYEEGHAAWILETDLQAGLAFGGLLVAFALMPTLMMFWENSGVDAVETSHGHEKKSILNAV